jgi:GNAT superfamily N-acetyltransferase
VEHRFVIGLADRDIQRQASENIWATYAALACTVPAVEKTDSEAYLAFRATGGHPLANFATRTRLNPWAARELAEMAGPTREFRVYLTPGDEPEHAAELLGRAGFRQEAELRIMVRTASAAATSEFGTLLPAPDNRREVIARFMADSFFGNRSAEFRQTVADCVVHAEGAELYEVGAGEIRAAAMLVRAGPMVGVYNLCVSPPLRGRGLGARFLAAVTASCELATLQCEKSLETWYARQGWRRIGNIRIFRLEPQERAVILRS